MAQTKPTASQISIDPIDGSNISTCQDLATVTQVDIIPLIEALEKGLGGGYQVTLTSDLGTVFHVGEGYQTTLRATVFHNGQDVTETIPLSAFSWQRRSLIPQEPPYDDATWNAKYSSGYAQVTINVDEFFARAVFTCTIYL